MELYAEVTVADITGDACVEGGSGWPRGVVRFDVVDPAGE